MIDFALFRQSLRCLCPRCGQSPLFQSRVDLRLKDQCSSCGLGLADNDNGDGPAVFLIFILGFLLVPLAVLFDVLVAPPLWVHAVLWGGVALGVTLLLLRPLKSYIMHLQYRHRPGAWKP